MVLWVQVPLSLPIHGLVVQLAGDASFRNWTVRVQIRPRLPIMANKAKKIQKLETNIKEMEQSIIDSLSAKSNGQAEINISKIQDRIREARQQIVLLKN